LRAPQLETDDAPIAVTPPLAQVQPGSTQPNPEAQKIVAELEKKAQEEADRKPYIRRRIPIDLIGGIALVGSGLVLMLKALLGGGAGGMFVTLINGILFPMILILLGAMCLVSWSKS